MLSSHFVLYFICSYVFLIVLPFCHRHSFTLISPLGWFLRGIWSPLLWSDWHYGRGQPQWWSQGGATSVFPLVSFSLYSYLKVPGRSIPNGTLSGCLFTFSTLLLLALFTALTCSPSLLHNDCMYVSVFALFLFMLQLQSLLILLLLQVHGWLHILETFRSCWCHPCDMVGLI